MKTPAGWVLDRAKLEKTIRTAVHFLDNVIEVNQYPLPEIDRMTRSTRKIGLGVMGFADMLLHMGVPYNSEEGVALAEEIMDTVNSIGHQASEELAEIRGPFPLFDQSIYRDGRPIRNATVTTIAPTGTLSIIAGVSSGVGAGVRLRLYPQCDGRHPPYRDQSDSEGQAGGGGHLLRRADAQNRGAGLPGPRGRHPGGHPAGCSSAPTTCPPSGM